METVPYFTLPGSYLEPDSAAELLPLAQELETFLDVRHEFHEEPLVENQEEELI